MAAQEEATAAATRRRKRGHPLLRRCKRERYTHGLHPAQMEALRAMCGALIPSLPVAEAGLRGDGGRKDLERFYHASAADGAIPEEVAELVTRCVWEAVVLVNVVLWILSTMVGTLALCGRLSCISGEFPYVRKFADMPPERREQALARWNKARWLFPLKITFVVIKILSHYAFYTTEEYGCLAQGSGSLTIPTLLSDISSSTGARLLCSVCMARARGTAACCSARRPRPEAANINFLPSMPIVSGSGDHNKLWRPRQEPKKTGKPQVDGNGMSSSLLQQSAANRGRKHSRGILIGVVMTSNKIRRSARRQAG